MPHCKAVSATRAGLLLPLLALGAHDPALQHFQDRVMPLLASRCVSCHGPDQQKGGLRLDSRAATLKGGDNGPALVPGKPAESLLVKAVMHVVPDLEMPPKEKLTPRDIAVFDRWIKDGAPWPETVVIEGTTKLPAGERLGDAWSDPRNPIVRIFGGQRLDLWSLKPIRPPPGRNSIDSFINAKPAAADRRTLARRLSFGLTGLPPTPEEMETFVNDRHPQAYERLVDKLLALPRYGEHWARQWLDVVRYSDSNGFDWDEFRPRAWKFRDYVIRSLNADKPFNQFIREQLAGDELLSGPPTNAAEQDYLIATGFLRLGPHDNSAPLFNEQARSRAELMADLVDTTGSAFLGLTMSCCRCHDHRSDPLSQADYFRMRAFFEPVKFADDLPLDLAPEQKKIRRQHATIDAKIKPLQQQVDALKKQKKEEEIKKLSKEIDALKKQKVSYTLGLLMSDTQEKVPATKILFQGDHKQEREAIEPGFLSALDPNPAPISKPPNAKTAGRRLTLAQWIVAPTNPLTARVLVNRVWLGHFGWGLVETPNDFGLAGARPSHPELLDWLASEFMRSGWSLKKLHRAIVNSDAYKQQQTVRRLSAEQLRDSLLAVSGLLRDRVGGPPVWPELPAEVLTANPALLDDNADKTKGWYPSAADRNVRSVYLVQKRTLRVPFMETFDLPENSTSCPRRNESIVPPQALSLMNSVESINAAKAFAARVQRETGSDCVQRVFQLALQRSPTADELAACADFLKARTLPELCRAVLNLNEFIYLD